MFTIVKLNAINSTNSYLKEWSKKNDTVESLVVVTNKQTHGRGQQGSRWLSDAGKNLTFSVLYKVKNLPTSKQFYLNCAVSLALYEALFPIIGKNLTIKWPNDIMSDSKKLGGILIENVVNKGKITKSVIGIGLNVNQIKFPDNLTVATSLKLLIKRDFDLETLLNAILKSLEKYLNILDKNFTNDLFTGYQKILFGRDKKLKFTADNDTFLAVINGVNIKGQLLVTLNNGKVKTFNNKEIKFLL
jgi:BirA family transcriptional regulator, biotin operon repressor / biotin---[acetyl-CoA-carboxylase] ligase